MSRNRAIVVGLAAATVSALLYAGLVSSGGASASDNPTSAAADATTPSVMPAAVKARVLEQHLVAVPASAAEVAAQKTAAVDAVSAARRSFGLDEAAPALSATLVRLTTPKMGTELERDDSKPSRIEPEYVDKLVWLVALEGVRDFYAGPKQPEGVDVPLVQVGVMIAAVDPSTSKALFAFVS